MKVREVPIDDAVGLTLATISRVSPPAASRARYSGGVT